MSGPVSLVVDDLQDLFLLFANDGRADKVVLSLTDTMYKKRVQTSGGNNCISKGGFRNFVKACPGLSDGHAFDVDYAFMQNLGYTDPKKPKFELNFEQFLDAIAMVATAKHPSVDAETAVRRIVEENVLPLYISRFGAPQPALSTGPSSGADDMASVGASFRSSPSGRISRRMTRVVVTADGMAAASATPRVGPKIALHVEQVVGEGGGDGTSLGPSGGGSARRMSVRMGASSDAGQLLRQSSFRNNTLSSRSAIVSFGTLDPFSPEARGASTAQLGGTEEEGEEGGDEEAAIEQEFAANLAGGPFSGTSSSSSGAGASPSVSTRQVASPLLAPAPVPVRTTTSHLHSPTPAPPSEEVVEMRTIIKELIGTVDVLRAQVRALKLENAQLVAQLPPSPRGKYVSY